MKNKTLSSYIFFDKTLAFGVLLLVLFASALAQATPYFQGLIVDNAILTYEASSLVSLSLVFAIVLILDAFARGYLTIIMTNLSYKISGNIRSDIFSGLLRKPLSFFEETNSGGIIQSTNSFVYYLGQTLAKGLNNISLGVSRFLIIFVYVVMLNFKLALVLGGLYVGVGLVMSLFARIIYEKGKVLKQAELHRNSLILENLSGLETYLAYENNSFMPHYTKVNSEYGKIRTKYYWLYNTLTPLADLLASLGTVIIYHIALGDILGFLEIGIIVSVLTYASRVSQPMQSISTGLGYIFDAKTTLDLVQGLNAEQGKDLKRSFKGKNFDITCQNLSYENPLQKAKIKNLNLEIPFGQKVKIVGRQGLGKTAFSHLLCGVYTPTSGKVFIGDNDISTLSRSAISKVVSVASDDVGIFKASILQNIRFGNKRASDKKVREAIKKSGLLPFVNKLPEKENTVINANMLSEGEKQLIAFARLLIKDTPIIIFDEFTRDLSPELKARFLKKLAKFSENKTLIYISQEKNTDFKFDKIINFQKTSS
ncbi:MAG: ABC transporter ATP-binding protein [Clostridia bacterium]|nr:ABC transporter ATP-binding protein [Clostridia bacterium]